MMLSYSYLQAIARRLTAAASAVSADERTVYVLNVTQASLISKEWKDDTLITEATIVDAVRPSSPAAYVVAPGIETVAYVDTSSRLRVLEFDEESDEWLERASNSILYEVDPSGNVAACSNELGSVVIFFQKRKGILASFTLDDPILTSEIHLHMQTGSPLWASYIRGLLHVFYISALDGCVHFAKRKNLESGWVDKAWTCQPFERTAKQLIVIPDLTANRVRCEAFLLTEDMVLLHIEASGEWSKLGRVDQTGDFVSERRVDVCCVEAQNNTLTEERLGALLSADPSIIDSFGGPLSLTPLAAACWGGHLEAVTILLDNPFRLANPNSLSPKSRSPLYFAVSPNSPPAFRKEIVSALLDAGADVDARSSEDHENTPLMIAVADTGDVGVVRELVSRGASLTMKNMRGQTAWMLAEGTDLEKELRPESQELQKAVPHSVQNEVIDVLVAITILFVAYINSDFVRDVMRCVLIELEASGQLGSEGVAGEDATCEVPGHSVVYKDAAPTARVHVSSAMDSEGHSAKSWKSTKSVSDVAPGIHAKLPVAYVKAPTQSKAQVSAARSIYAEAQ